MKNQILDEFTDSPLHRRLEKGEKIIWEGAPLKASSFSLTQMDNNLISYVAVLGSLALTFGYILLFSIGEGISTVRLIIYFSIYVVIVVQFLPSQNQALKKTQYLVSNHRILFQLWIENSEQIEEIQFTEIRDVIVSFDTDHEGTIYLAVKNPNSIPFDTQNLQTGEKRHQPTLEMIENVDQVAQLIRLQIKNNWKTNTA